MGARVCAAMIVLCSLATAGLEFHGQASGWLGGGYGTSWFGQAGLRYLPDLQFSLPLGEQLMLDADGSANGYVSAVSRTRRYEVDAKLKPYRAYVRLSSDRFEARAGLQRINFGSAMLLRPLQWFDRLDPRDPLGMTDGVWGLLGRYYFQNNANLWAWGLIGNSSPKGWEQFGSERWQPEFGGRAQLPVPRGEVAATYHHRSRSLMWVPDTFFGDYIEVAAREDRIGFDGRWDIGIGLSFEATMGRTGALEYSDDAYWQRAAMVGLDYTFGIGSGFGAALEHMAFGTKLAPFECGFPHDRQVTALMLSYPVSLLDNLRGFVYFDWKGRSLYRLVSWQRTYDRWLWSVSAFWNPDAPAAVVGGQSAGTAGKGVMLTVAFNH
jgi:hypothetical protein